MSTKTLTATMVKNFIDEQYIHHGSTLAADKVFKNKQGEFVLRRTFFYPHGFTSEKLAAKVKAVFPEAEIVGHDEVWNSWPKDSYWEVAFRLTSLPEVK